MYIITSGMSPEEEHLAHYGVLGMKWHVHKAKNNRAHADAIKRSQDDLYSRARNLRADAVEQKKAHNTVTAKSMKKKARTLEKQGEKLDKPIDKYMAKAQAYLDKNAANLDMKMAKAEEKYANSIKAAKEYYSESAKIGSRGNDLYSIGDVNAAKVDWQLANDKLAAGQSIENRANKKLEKTEKSITKKRKKYTTLEHSMVIKTYGVSENELYHHGVKGMHWGVRRYQNYDGTLIKAGSAVQKKTKYTNIDGSLNERGKLHSQKYISKQIKKNNKYYDKQIKKYNKLLAKCGDDKKMQKTFKDMIKDAERTRNSVNENIKKFGIDQIMTNERETTTKTLKAIGMITAGTAITATGVGGGLVAAANAGMISAGAAKVGETLMKFDPMTVADKAYDFALNDPRGQKVSEYVDGAIGTYAAARSYVMGTYINESVKRLDQLGVIDNVSTAIGGGGAAAANAFTNNLNTQNQALVSNLSNPNNVQILNSMLSNTATNANQLATSFDPAMVASMESLYSNPQYAQALAYANQMKVR